MKFKNKRFLLYFSLLIGMFSNISQAKILTELKSNIRFHKLVNANKLSTVVVNDIVQDNEGFIWIATPDGLNRFDGLNNTIYRSTKTQRKSLSHNHITCLLKDHSGAIWIGTKKGLNLYNLLSDSFELVNDTFTNPDNFLNSEILAVYEDFQNQIWISTSIGGISRISEDRKKLTHFKLKQQDISQKIYFRSIAETDDHKILFATNSGIFQYNKTSDVVELFQKNKSSSINSLNANKILAIDSETLLIGTLNGLNSFNRKNNTLSEAFPNMLSQKSISELFKLENDKIAVGTRESGLYIIDLINNSSKHFQNGPNKYNVNDNLIKKLYFDNNHHLWVGTNLGINIVDFKQEVFNLSEYKVNNTECLSGNIIYSIILDKSETLWIASYGHGLHQIDLNADKCIFFNQSINSNGLTNLKNIVSLYEDRYDNIWIGTYSDGVFVYNRKLNKVFKFEPKINIGSAIPPKLITKITGDDKGNIFIATQKTGLYIYNDENDSLERFTPNINNVSKYTFESIKDLQHDGADKIWLVTINNGLWYFDIPSKLFKKLILKKYQLPENLQTISIFNKDTIWVGSKGEGAIKISIQSGDTNKFTTENGLLSNIILNIIQDNNGDIWLFTDKGLSRISKLNSHVVTFLKSDGFQNDAFTTTGFFDKKNNLIWTGGISGFNYFSPNKINQNTTINRATITDFELLYKSVKISDKQLNSPLKKPINITKKITLEHQQNVIAFSFSALEYLFTERIKYRYMLKGFDNEWNEVTADRNYANYTNIDPGNYTFRVKASNKFGEWSDLETTIDIIISPPWWKTNYAYMAYIILSIFSLYAFIKIRTNVLEQRAKTLEATVTQRTLELASEKSKVEQLLSRKNEEFANVSHEFRTPLTLILGPLSQIIKTAKNEKELEKLGVIQRNGYRLLRMVDQLLNMETFRIKSITQRAPQAIGRTVSMLTEAFADLAHEKGIDLTLANKLNINFEFTPDALEKILLNLLSNAVKYTRPGGHITVATERTNNKELKLSVSDTGIGIPEDKLQSIFERYSRVLDENSEQVAGAGIGLALVKELVEAHQGRIEVESQLGKGTTIIVYLPIIGEVDDEQVRLHNNDEIVAMELMSLTNQSTLQSSQSQVVQLDERLDKPSVLVIEDNADMRAYISNSIQDDYQVLTAKDGEEGVAVAIEQVPDLIISDIMMPKKDGYQTTQELRNNSATNHIPIILLTARGDRESRLKGWYEKADEYLTKPFDVEELKIRLKNLLDIREILRKRFAETAFEQSPQLTPVSSDDVDSNKENLQFGFIQQLNQELERLHTETSSTIAEIAEALHMSERQFFRKVKSVVDMTPSDYLRRFRLEKAKSLLIEGKNANFSAYEVGFSSQSYFGKCFKAQFGMSPKEFVSSLNLRVEDIS